MMAIANRLGAWVEKKFPYDAEVQWLEKYAHGAYRSIGPIFKIDVDTSFGKIGFKTAIKVNSAYKAWDIKYFGRSTRNATRLGLSQYQSKIRGTDIPVPDDWIYVDCDASPSGMGTLIVGEKTNRIPSWWTSNYTSGELIDYVPIFGEANSAAASTGYVNAIGGISMKYFQLTRDGNLIADVIFVRKGGVGMAYDRVSKKLIEPSSLGVAGEVPFIIGPDVLSDGGGYKCIRRFSSRFSRRSTRLLRNPTEWRVAA